MNCKVIATSFSGNRNVRTPRTHENLKFPDHYQRIICEHDALEQLKGVVAFELEQEPGVKMDTIIVNSDVGFEEGNRYVESLDGSFTKSGRIWTLTRQNAGWSFGAYSAAFERFRDSYRFWLFTEDDILVGGENYYQKLITRWEEGGVEFLALVKAVDHPWGRHAGGGVGFTEREVLARIWDEHGMLPHHTGNSAPHVDVLTERDKVIRAGEVAFTNTIHTQGGVIADYGPNTSWSLEDNLCIPYYDYEKA